MATVRGGDIRQFKINGREFEPSPEAAFEIMEGGFDNEYKAAGNGVMVGTQKRVLGGIDGAEVSIDSSRGDLEYLQDIKNAGEPVSVVLGTADGQTWRGSLGIEGELKLNTGTGAAGLTMRGPKMERI